MGVLTYFLSWRIPTLHPEKWSSDISLCIIAEEMSKGESIFRGAGITVEDEFTNDNFDEEEEAGEGWIEERDEVRKWKKQATSSPSIKMSRWKEKKLRV